MVGHQAIRPHRDALFAALNARQIALEFVNGIAEEDFLAPVAALRHMMRQAGENEAGDAGRGSAWARGRRCARLDSTGVKQSVIVTTVTTSPA